MFQTHRIVRAFLVGISVFLSNLLVYQHVPTLDQVWQPGLQAGLAMLAALGINAGVARRG